MASRVARSKALAAAVLSLTAVTTALAQDLAGTFKYVGESGVSAQQVSFLGNAGKVYIIDKTENNPAQVAGHPAWASEYDLATNTFRTMDVVSNSFCAGGTVLGNGTWLNVGGNQAVITGGNPAGPMGSAAQDGDNIYGNADGGKALRLLDTCTDKNCDWVDDPALYLTSRRWYPTLETLEDGSAIIIGGCEWGGYVNNPGQDNPTYEFFPSKGVPITMNFLTNTLPVNLFPLTWLLPSGNLFIQAEFQAIVFDYKKAIEYELPNIPSAVRVYPASGGTAMFPLTPANNWTATMIFCGGTNLDKTQWVTNWAIVKYPADNSCVTISPDIDVNWYTDDSLDTGRTMGQFINLPDGRLLFLNGGALGTAGYGPEDWAIGQSYADQPLHDAWYFDPSQPKGSRWSKAGTSNIDRLYHSSATLLPDGSVFVSGSNPNADYVSQAAPPAGDYKYWTQYQVEIFYPSYYDKTRPVVTGIPQSITYGGDYFDLPLALNETLFGNSLNANKTKALIMRTGFSTHAINFGMRHVELETTFTTAEDGSATLHVAQLPPNPAILAPGPALFFIVVDGVPSQGVFITVGDGIIGKHTIKDASSLPGSTMPAQVVADAQAAFSA